jgi:hypothetical protein
MAQIITINQLNDKFKGFVDKHYFLNDYGMGPTSEIGTSRQMEFPYMWVTLGDNTQIGTANNTAIPKLDITFIFADQINNQATGDLFNQVENLSDCFQYAQDLITWISTELNQFGVKLDGDARLYPVIDETVDSVNGWAMTLILKLTHHNCVIPQGL